MITFTIKFLLLFILKANNKDVKEKKKPIGKPNKKKKTIEVEETDPPNLIRLDKYHGFVHIDYQLLPVKCKPYQIDVLCWKNAAKIFTADGTKIFKTVCKNGITFVPVCIQHYLKELTIDELISLRNWVVEFNVSTEKSKLGASAKLDKSNVIYVKTSDIDRTGFIEGFNNMASSSAASSSNTSATENSEDAISKNIVYQKNEVFSKMNFTEHFADKFYEIIDYLCEETIPKEQIIFRDFIKACNLSASPEVSKAKKADKPSKKGGKKEAKPKSAKTTGKFKMQMQGEIFFTDSEPIFKLENQRSELSKMFVIPQVENMLTRLQKIHLNPIIIKIKSIENFPADHLENTDFTHAYCKYTIPYIAECTTIEKPIDTTMSFMESHIFFTQTLSKIKLLEFLESKRLLVEIFGILRYQNVDSNPTIFGSKPEDFEISNIQSKMNCLRPEENQRVKHVLLAYCSFDLSSLLKNVWDFRKKEQLHTSESRIISGFVPELHEILTNEDDHSCAFWSHYNVTMNEINLAGIPTSTPHNCPLKEWLLMQNNTVLVLEAYLLSPQSAALVLHQVPNTFKRLLLISTNKELMQKWFGDVLKHNQDIICQDLKNDDILTGFLIDNGNNFMAYVEGRSVGYILNAWKDLADLTIQDGKVFFNTDQAYENRLYKICNKWSGFYAINMKIPLQDIFKNQKVYIKGNVPFLCQKAIVKLNLLLLTNTMKVMFQQNLFPSLEELLSLDIEYGVPYAWRPLMGSDISGSTDQSEIRQSKETM